MKAQLKYYAKMRIHDRYVVELSIFYVGKSAQYTDCIKYGLICKDLRTGNFVLLDNHHPKGPHIHINKEEFPYKYVNDDQLIKDFNHLVLKELGVKL